MFQHLRLCEFYKPSATCRRVMAHVLPPHDVCHVQQHKPACNPSWILLTKLLHVCQRRDMLHPNRRACSPVALVFMQQAGVLGHRDWTRTTFLRGDDEEYTLATRGRMMERLQVILAGRAAEEVAFDMPTTYSMSDLKVSKPCSAVSTPAFWYCRSVA